MRWTSSRIRTKNLLLGSLLAIVGASSGCGLGPESAECEDGEVREGDACIDASCSAARWEELQAQGLVAVSYTHLTLPTIYSV